MITNVDIKKMQAVFATKEELKSLDTKMGKGFVEIINFIGEIRSEIVELMSKQLEELKEITRRHQMTLENQDSRITHLEYVTKST